MRTFYTYINLPHYLWGTHKGHEQFPRLPRLIQLPNDTVFRWVCVFSQQRKKRSQQTTMNMRLAIMSKKRFFSVLHTFLLLGLQHLSMTNGMPNPKLDPISCNGDSTTTRICDPDFALSMNEKHRIQQYIGWFEQLNVTCHEQVVGVQMGVVVVGSVSV